ncbi:MAG: hypothetical protein LW884_00350 [Bacteroidetes bacterium]|jgi:hypothetical protein|nr:hypothetical protein [Bacteroidota bacterium]
MHTQYKLAVHWPLAQRLELHLTDGEVRELTGAAVSVALNTLRQNAVPVIFMPVGDTWQHTGLLAQSYDLNKRVN